MGAFRDLLAAADSHCIRVLSGPDVVVYRAGDGVTASISGIFDDSYKAQDAGYIDVQSSGPTFFCRESELTSDPRCDSGASFQINGNSYAIREVKPDGQGAVMFLLHREDC